jgi:hypothetical protein
LDTLLAGSDGINSGVERIGGEYSTFVDGGFQPVIFCRIALAVLCDGQRV